MAASAGEEVHQRQTAGDHGHGGAVHAAGQQRHDEHGVEEAEQEEDDGHPDLQAGVLAE
jgi:hypothetical protein